MCPYGPHQMLIAHQPVCSVRALGPRMLCWPEGPSPRARLVPALSEWSLTGQGALVLQGTRTLSAADWPPPTQLSPWRELPAPSLLAGPRRAWASSSSASSFSGPGPSSCWAQRDCHSLSQLPPRGACVWAKLSQERINTTDTREGIDTTSSSPSLMGLD